MHTPDRRRQPHGQKHIDKDTIRYMANMMDEFEALLEESFEMDTPEEGSVVKGKVIAIEAGQAIIDVGYKMEGRVEL
jgi:hypothetical protein